AVPTAIRGWSRLGPRRATLDTPYPRAQRGGRSIPPGQAAAEPRGAAERQPRDTDLLERYRQVCDGEAFAGLVRRHGPLVRGGCRQGGEGSRGGDQRSRSHDHLAVAFDPLLGLRAVHPWRLFYPTDGQRFHGQGPAAALRPVGPNPVAD